VIKTANYAKLNITNLKPGSGRLLFTPSSQETDRVYNKLQKKTLSTTCIHVLTLLPQARPMSGQH